MANNLVLWERLDSLCNIIISGVDKKTKDNETTVRLCNFTDVYKNWALYKEDYNSFMVATASNKDIERLSLKEGDVCITKDSETRDDIGMSTYIASDYPNVVLGYHCALLRPKEEQKIYGPYLKAYLASYLGRKYFSQQSSGSGQRYTLTIESISAIKVPVICFEQQKKIGDLLLNIDKQIHFNSLFSRTLEETAKTLYDYWFTQFDFPNEEGKPYRSSGGKMVWNEELKREIPEGWEVKKLESFVNVTRGVAFSPRDVSNFPKEGYVPLLKSNNIQNGHILFDSVIYVPNDLVSLDQYLGEGSIFITMSSGSIDHVGKVALFSYDSPYTFGAFCAKIKIDPNYKGYISEFYLGEFFRKHIKTIVSGTNINNINIEHITGLSIPVPPAKLLQEFESLICPIQYQRGNNIRQNLVLSSLRDYLLPLLMNGQVTIED